MAPVDRLSLVYCGMEVIILNIQEAKTHLSRHVDAVAAGAEIIIAKAGKPMAKLVPYKSERAPRKLGRLAGVVPP